MLIKLKKITKTYHSKSNKVDALKGVDLQIEKGEFLSIMGPSGSGKSTLLNILGCLHMPSSGYYLLDNENIEKYIDDQISNIRNKKIGFVFQSFHLIPQLTALENVMLPLVYGNRTQNKEEKMKESIGFLKLVGLEKRINHKPFELSGGQQQRVAIARALVTKPLILLADEPTGNLDSKTSIEIMNIFEDLNKQGITIIFVTHNDDIANYSSRKIVFKDGLIDTNEIVRKH